MIEDKCEYEYCEHDNDNENDFSEYTHTDFKKLFRKIQPCFFDGDDDEKLLKNYFSKCFDHLISRIHFTRETSNLSKIVFSEYLNLPMVISDQIYESFLVHGEERLSKYGFVFGMFDLFFGALDRLKLLTFKIINVNENLTLTKNDLTLFFTYLNYACGNPVHNLDEILNNFFINDTTSGISLEEYTEKIQNNNSDIFILFLLLIYKNQPFTENVFKFYRENNNKNSDSKKNTKGSYGVSLFRKKEFIAAPSKNVIIYLKDFCNVFPTPVRKASTKNVLNFKELFKSNNDLIKMCPYEEFDLNEEFVKIVNNNFVHKNNNDNNNNDKYESSRTFSSLETNEFSNSNHNSSNNLWEKKLDPHYFRTDDVYELIKTSKEKTMKRIEFVLIDNNLFTFQYNSSTNKESSSKKTSSKDSSSKINISSSKDNLTEFFEIQKVLPLSGGHLTFCDEFKFGDVIYYPFCLLCQYGNSLANVNNIFLTSSQSSLTKIVNQLKNQMNTRVINDRYEINCSNQLGKGVFGTVTLAEDKLTHEKVAVKMINKNSLQDEEFFEMIKNEIDIMKILKQNPHKNIITPLDIFEDKFFIYLVLEYLPGGTLKSYLANKEKPTETEVKNIIKQIADAISFLDKFGIIHRDIKLENILLGTNDLSNLKLSDFGLSTVKFNSLKAFETCGTLSYSAPELLAQFPYDKKIDIWSLGVLTFYLLCENFPFCGSNKKDVIYKICRERLSFPFAINEYSGPCKNFIENCLCKNPFKRFDINEVLLSPFLKCKSKPCINNLNK